MHISMYSRGADQVIDHSASYPSTAAVPISGAIYRAPSHSSNGALSTITNLTCSAWQARPVGAKSR
jgi:hypothetical protein